MQPISWNPGWCCIYLIWPILIPQTRQIILITNILFDLKIYSKTRFLNCLMSYILIKCHMMNNKDHSRKIIQGKFRITWQIKAWTTAGNWCGEGLPQTPCWMKSQWSNDSTGSDSTVKHLNVASKAFKNLFPHGTAIFFNYYEEIEKLQIWDWSQCQNEGGAVIVVLQHLSNIGVFL